MNALISTVTGQFSKALILGALFPAVIAVFVFVAFVLPLLPTGFVPEPLRVLFADTEAVAVTVVIAVVAAFLHALSIPIIRLYEGYPWRDGWIGRWLTRKQRAEFDRLRSIKLGVDRLLVDKSRFDEASLDRINFESSAFLRALREEFPKWDALILPTRLGNAIRSFETYPSTEYGMDAIALWPRLVHYLDDGLASSIDDARVNVVFFLNTSLLAVGLGLMILTAGFGSANATVGSVFLPAGGLLLASVLLYNSAVGAVNDWGTLVKSAFDLRRHLLLKDLTGKDERPGRREERTLWTRITAQFVYGDGPDGPYVDGDSSTPSDEATYQPVKCEGVADREIECARGLLAGDSPDELIVVIQALNTHATSSASNVRILDSPPDGFDYEWDTATISGTSVTVRGIRRPYTFIVANRLKAQETLELRYRARRIVRTPNA